MFKKQKQINGSGDCEDRSKITALTTGTESQLEQPAYDSENGDKSTLENKKYQSNHRKTT